MWTLYDMLIDAIPAGITVAKTVLGEHWAALESSEGGMGLAMKIDSETFPFAHDTDFSGMPLRELAARAKSWNFVEAAFGVAAMNAYYNYPERAHALGIDISCSSMANEAFQKYRAALAGKKAAVVGHFPYLENLLAPVCELSIVERRPQMGDFPDPACEYILPRQDYVFITGSSLVNKTLPRLLQICASRFVVLVGPSVPLTPMLFDFGINDLSGFVVLDNALCFSAVQDHIEGRHFSAGTMVNFLSKEPLINSYKAVRRFC